MLDGYPLVGAISNVGVLLWWLAAGICLFTFSLARTLGFTRSVRVFLLTSGLLSALLAIDDLFLFHDDLATQLLGLRERHVMLAYLVLVGAWALLNMRVIRDSEWLILAIAAACFAGSIGSDYVTQVGLSDADELGKGLDWGLVIEDGLKFVGIAGWTAYFVRFSQRAVRERFTPGEDLTSESAHSSSGQG